jgi:hypothetical protein
VAHVRAIKHGNGERQMLITQMMLQAIDEQIVNPSTDSLLHGFTSEQLYQIRVFVDSYWSTEFEGVQLDDDDPMGTHHGRGE